MALSLYKVGKGRRGKKKANESNKKKKPPGLIRMQCDMNELELPDNVKVLPQKDIWNKFDVQIIPQIGYWAGFKYNFEFHIPTNYPYKPPKVQCKDPIYHYMIHPNGRICSLNILTSDWRPIVSLNTVILAILQVFHYGKSWFIQYYDKLLFHGYVRQFAMCIRNVPVSITDLCMEFYNHEMNKFVDSAPKARSCQETAFRLWKDDPKLFEQNVNRSLKGETIDSVKYTKKQYHFVRP